jgi:nucleoside-diphosphate-sugar epimerase
MSRHLVTGATGFVGSWLTLDLLRDPEAEVLCLVRESAGADPGERLLDHLRNTAASHDHGLPARLADRVRVVPGDLADPQLADHAEIDTAVDQVWHCAASLKYRDADAVEIDATNVGGTARIVHLARRLEATDFNHISTAYVAGTATGLIPEELFPADHPTNNRYERSKLAAEHLVAAAGFATTRIFRPSIVIGHAENFAADSTMGVFGFLRDMSRFARAANRSDRPVRSINLLADPDATLNMIPVNVVTSSAVDIAAARQRGVYHLTNGTPPRIGPAMRIATRLLGLPEPVFTSDPERLTRLDRRMNRFLDFYLPYLGAERRFDRTNTDAVVGNRCDYDLGDPVVERLIQSWLTAHR